ncbi:AraC family transcriptional regulator [Sphingomonas sp. S2-65]|uniref:AraC family transcriptional regulator n=1 Tax=Sphingomonas sp. S2-65 TaxID=2903960 RepID=UPI001F1C62FB|nr:AraC family transcriptional regulator [Sphingomonas sp. S2-65]UYY58579.1 AraC family transcriptional regulator [Sphingomonas sp. S2-65]
MHEELSRLRGLVLRHIQLGTQHTIPGARFHSATAPTAPVSGVYEPMLCVVLQGAKHVTIGDRTMRYDPSSYFVASVELPAAGWITEASPEHPYVALGITIDRAMLTDLIAQVPVQPDAATAGFAVNAVTPQLLGSVARLLDLLDNPGDAPVLAPMLHREILYRLLQCETGSTLCQIARADSRLSQVQRAIAWIRDNYDAPLSVDALATLAGMSKASLHRHFKAATAMSPLQYQKQLRLEAARRLLVGHTDAQRAAHHVGYESASQFSREYARMFGLPPARDAERLRSGQLPLATAQVLG